jgi:hypothetical protein
MVRFKKTLPTPFDPETGDPNRNLIVYEAYDDESWSGDAPHVDSEDAVLPYLQAIRAMRAPKGMGDCSMTRATYDHMTVENGRFVIEEGNVPTCGHIFRLHLAPEYAARFDAFLAAGDVA